MGKVIEAWKQAQKDFDIDELREENRKLRDRNAELMRTLMFLQNDINEIIDMVEWIEEENDTKYQLENDVDFVNYLYCVKSRIETAQYQNKESECEI